MSQPDFPHQERRVVKIPDYLDERGVPTCPKCGCQDFDVTHSYAWSQGAKRRRRVCNHCGYVLPPTKEIFDETAE